MEQQNNQLPAGDNNRLDFIKKHLPDLLLKGANAFKTEEEQFLYLYLTLASVSGLLTKVTGQYRDQEVSPNLYCAGIARPASGKGLISFVQRQFTKIHLHHFEKSNDQIEEYRVALKEYNKEKKKDESCMMPKRPPFKVVFIPANCTSAKLLQHLQDNQTNGVIPSILSDAEIDSLVGSLESDLANISSILRKAFHGETISMSRKTDNEYMEIRNCQLALALTGTPNQFIKLVNNRSDGLMSRFMVYMIDTPPSVSGIRRCPTCPDVKKVFDDLASEYFRFWEFMEIEGFEVELSDDQLETLEQYLKDKLDLSIAEHCDDVAQIILRHGLMAFKLCMILTAFRKFEYAESNHKMACDENDFTIALQLIDISIRHSLRFFEMLPDATYSRKSGHKQKFLDALPIDFNRKQALEASKGLGGDRTLDRWLSSFVKEGKVLQIASGQYKKV